EKGDKVAIIDMQEQYFSDINYQCYNWSVFSYIECLDSHIKLADLQNGDILISSSTHISSWRSGHAAIVVDAKNGIMINAVQAGSLSELESIADFTDRASVMVLRPKLDEETRQSVAEYARENLVGIPYSATVGILSPKYEETIKTTQCSHLVWYAYMKFGIDIDSNGGGLVTPKDIANSEYLDVVQIYGFDPDDLWK
ncbi:MAG: YiiX/YebB-like N1pC/P60 family cysteine hydrolase, partial [Eubacteriales bacterium]